MDSRRALVRGDALTPKGRSARSRAVACGLRSSLYYRFRPLTVGTLLNPVANEQ